MRRHSIAPIVAASIFVLAACGDDQVQAVRSDIRVIATHVSDDGDPLLDFGPVAVLNKRVLKVLVENHGRAAVRIEDVGLSDPEGVFFVTGDFAMHELPAGASIEIPVTFQPEAQEGYEGTFILRHDDDRKGAVEIQMIGVGSTVGRIEIDPPSIDFGVVGEGTQEIRTLTIRSVGTGPLVIDSVEFVDTPPEFTFQGSTRPAILPPPADGQPGGVVDLRIVCSPTVATEEANLQGTVRLVTSDPDKREVLIPLKALVNRAPIAVIEVDPGNHVAGVAIALDGSDSSDPDNDVPLGFEWRIFDKPFGAEAIFSDPRSPTPTLTVDTPGQYEVGLDVVDARGLYCHSPGGDTRIPCTRKLITVKSDIDLEIQLIWNHEITDLDLHLRENDAPLYSDVDCYSENPKPDFGTIGDQADDPRMTHDSLKGFGPERIAFATPAEGRYDVTVVFAKANGSRSPASKATVRIYVYGTLQAELTRTLDTPDQIWEVLSIDWPSAQLTPVDVVHTAVTP